MTRSSMAGRRPIGAAVLACAVALGTTACGGSPTPEGGIAAPPPGDAPREVPAVPAAPVATDPARAEPERPAPPPATGVQADPAMPAADRHARLLGLEPGASLILINGETGQGATDHYRYAQAYRGVRVEGHNFVVHEPRDGGALWMSGEPIRGFAAAVPTVEPTLSAAQATEIALREIMDAHPRARIDGKTAELRIVLDDARRPRLAYVVKIDGVLPDEGDGPLGEQIAVDARDGRIAGRERTWID